MTIHGDVVSHVNISRVRIEDGGQYACAVANRAGAVRHTARLNVYGKARMDGNVTHMEYNSTARSVPSVARFLYLS